MRRRSRLRFRLAAAIVPVTLALLLSRGARAEMSQEELAARADVIVTVGPRSITRGELEDRLAKVPPRQLSAFGATADEVRHRFLEQVVIPEALLAEGAARKKIAEQGSVKLAVLHAQSNAALRHARAALGLASSIPLAEVAQYFEAHRSDYETKQRISVWRILCKTEDEAKTVLAAAMKDGTPKTFIDLARDHSLDKATYLRGGNVGFLAPDGTSNEAGLKVDPAIVKAAAEVKDGEMVGHPVPEGENFAVVWRRGTTAGTNTPLDAAMGSIREILWKEKAEHAERALIDELRKRDLRDVNEDLVVTLDVPEPKPVMITHKKQ